MAKLAQTASRDLHDAKAVVRGGSIRADNSLTDQDCRSLDRMTAELDQCYKNENGIRKRKAKLTGAINALVGRYRREGEQYVRYLYKDKVLIFRGGNGSNQTG